MTEQLDAVVIGAGVVGLAVARALALDGREVIVLEAEPNIGMHTSSRNSEVIHAGIYYPENSLKARFCVEGKEKLYQYCESRDIPHNRLGKLIVATDQSEVSQLDKIQSMAEKNGVADLRVLDKADVQRLEPNVKCAAALFSPSTGIIDSHVFMLSLQADIEANRGMVLTNTCVSHVEIGEKEFLIEVDGSAERVSCRTLVNSAGLSAGTVARGMRTLDSAFAPEIYFAKGHYFSYRGRSPFQHLVYPVPVDGGLGVHATNDLAGSARFGPDVEWVDGVDYEFDSGRLSGFVDSIRRYFPAVDDARLAPAYTGIRPKLTRPGQAPADFRIEGHEDHAIHGLVNMYGIESPGLTASLAIGDHVAMLLQRH